MIVREVERLSLWSFDGHVALFGHKDARTCDALAERARIMRALGMPEAEDTVRRDLDYHYRSILCESFSPFGMLSLTCMFMVMS